MAKFKVGQVVTLATKYSSEPEYHRISGIAKQDGGDIFFVDGETAVKEPISGNYVNAFYFPYMLRKLTAREAGR